MGIANLSYEECRRKRVEENKKRMDALNLPLLSQALIDSSPSKSKSSPVISFRFFFFLLNLLLLCVFPWNIELILRLNRSRVNRPSIVT